MTDDSQLWALPPAPGLATPRLPDEAVEDLPLRRVRVRPVAVARALALIKSFAVQHGLSHDEREEIAVFVRENDILFAADWDRGHTRTADGRERPFRYRHSVPLEDEGEGAAEWVGVVIRPQDLQEAFRNRVENSDHFGVLADDRPVALEVFAAASGPDAQSRPHRLVVHPDPARNLGAREVFALRGASLDDLQDIEPQVASSGLSDLDADALFEMAGLASEAVGMLLDPRMHTPVRSAQQSPTAPAYLAAVGPRAVTVAFFDSPIRQAEAGGAPDQSDIFDGTQPAATPQADAAGDRCLTGPVILSPRFAETLGLSQGAFEEVRRLAHRDVVADQHLKIQAAALAAALDVSGSELLVQIRRAVGQKAALSARAAAADERGDEGAVAYARHILDGVPVPRQHDVARVLEIAMDLSATPDDASFRLAALTQGDTAQARVARAVLAAPDAVALDDVAAEAVGAALLRDALPRVIVAADDAAESVTANYGDYGLAAMSVAGSGFKNITAKGLDAVPEQSRAEWWEAFARRMKALDLSPETVGDLVSDSGPSGAPIPDVRALRPSPRLRASSLKETQASVKGRIWSSDDGRVYAGFGDERAGWVWFSDLPVQPRPDHFPLQDADVRALTEDFAERQGSIGELSVAWGGTVPREDLQTIVNRAVGLASRDDGPAAEGRTLLVGRWTPPGLDPAGELAAHIPAIANPDALERAQTVYIEEGTELRRFSVEPSYDPAKLLDPVKHGAFRLLAFEDGGEHAWFDMPLHGPQPVWASDPKQPAAFALDADSLGDAIGFASRRGDTTSVQLLDGVLRVHDPQRHHVALLPTLTRTDVPDRFEAVFRAAGIPGGAYDPLPVRDIINRAREMQVLRVPSTELPVRATGESIRWRARPRSEPGQVVRADAYERASIDLFAESRRLKRVIAEHRRRRELDDRSHDRGVQLDLLGGNEKVYSLSHIRAGYQAKINRRERELDELQRVLADRIRVDESAPEPGVGRVGQGNQRILTSDHLVGIEEDADEPVAAEPIAAERVSPRPRGAR